MAAAARKIALTDRSLKALKPSPDGRRLTIWDALLPGLGVRVSALGRRSFYAVKRQPGAAQPTWYHLGSYPAMGLGEARAAAREAVSALMEGKHPKVLVEAKRRAEAATAADTFALIAARFVAEYCPSIKSGKTYAARIRREMIPAFGDKPIVELRRRDVIRMLEE